MDRARRAGQWQAPSQGSGAAQWGRLLVCLFGVAPWLSEPGSLEEAYGTKGRRRPPPDDAKKRFEKPPMQESFRQRVRNITPYPDIVAQVEKNCHGKGGFRQARAKAGLQDRPDVKKIKPTELDKLAMSLETSRSARYAKATLTNEAGWPEPDPQFPEVAFAGRSNVGKSTLLNKISKFGTIARVSNMPGMTKHVAWYRNRKIKLDVIDMPGYGHSDRARVFGPACLDFVMKRTALKALYILIDARHGFKRTDHEWLAELGTKGPLKQVILTKCDLVAKKELIKIASLARSDLEGHRRVEHRILLASSAWDSGLHDIRMDICRRAGLAGDGDGGGGHRGRQRPDSFENRVQLPDRF